MSLNDKILLICDAVIHDRVTKRTMNLCHEVSIALQGGAQVLEPSPDLIIDDSMTDTSPVKPKTPRRKKDGDA